jgi:hypothetical protein
MQAKFYTLAGKFNLIKNLVIDTLRRTRLQNQRCIFILHYYLTDHSEENYLIFRWKVNVPFSPGATFAIASLYS